MKKDSQTERLFTEKEFFVHLLIFFLTWSYLCDFFFPPENVHCKHHLKQQVGEPVYEGKEGCVFVCTVQLSGLWVWCFWLKHRPVQEVLN